MTPKQLYEDKPNYLAGGGVSEEGEGMRKPTPIRVWAI